MRHLLLVALCFALTSMTVRAQTTNAPSATNNLSLVIEVAGTVEFALAGAPGWQGARVGLTLKPGDRLRTQPQSRAALQFSDRSIIRLNERTTLEILPPRRAEKRRFGLPRGSLFFFNRERPADVEFDTPLAAGAIRGTEFMLEVADGQPTLRLALIDGLVALQTGAGEEIALERGQELRLAPGQAPQKTALVNAVNAIQWALYYPAVVNPDDLTFTAGEQAALADALTHYRAGGVLTALAALPPAAPGDGMGTRSFRAALELAVGRVAETEAALNGLPAKGPVPAALRELIAAVRGESRPTTEPQSSSEWLARSYSLQARADLPGALAAAARAAKLAPQFGFAHARVAELEFAFEHRRETLAALDRAINLSPRLAPAHALRGFVGLEQDDVSAALAAFDRARELDAALGPAWLGRGLCLLRQRRNSEARAAFQAAAALEPQRALFRDFLGKAASELGDAPAARKEFNLAQRLDPKDPTGWLYSALERWQQNEFNDAIRDLERSIDLNDQRAPIRSRLLLDRDRSTRSANLAALYEDAGLPDVSRHAAARAVAEDYGNFSGHLFLANSYQSLEDVNRFDLRLETARQSELLVANLLAPPGAGNLSQQLSQHEHVRFFEPRPAGVSSLTEYGSAGDWRQAGTIFGTVKGLSYAFDASYESLRGQRANEEAERRQFFLTLKQRVTPDDEFYFQAGHFTSDSGDLERLYDPAKATLGFHAQETQEPTLYAGWHHAWSPGSHTLLLFARLNDRLTLRDPDPNVLFLQQGGGGTVSVQTPPFFNLDFHSDFTLYSTELQQVWETPRHSLIVGGRWQTGDTDSRAILSRTATGVVTDQDVGNSLERGNVYAYSSWQVFEPLRLVAGVSYDHLSFPENSDLAPVSDHQATRDLVAPKAGLLYTPWQRGLLRASYTRSLGGLFFDNSVRLEPTQVGGFNQAFRSLIPESVAGLVPGTQFDTAAVGFDQSFRSGTWMGIEAEWLQSEGDRTAGALTNSTFLPIPDTASSTRQNLKFRERNLSAYAAQLLGDYFSVSARYRLSQARLRSLFPEIPAGAPGLDLLEQHNRSTLHQVSLAANFHHPNGLFAQWESTWYQQSNFGYNDVRPGDDFWQHNLFVGYRFPRRYAELRFGLLNVFDTDYRLNPLNLYAALPRERTFTASLRLNF